MLVSMVLAAMGERGQRRVMRVAEILLMWSEAKIRRGVAQFNASPRMFAVAVCLLLLVAGAVRVDSSLNDEVVKAWKHPDSAEYFNYPYTHMIDGAMVPEPHRGSGLQLSVYALFLLYDVENVPGDYAAQGRWMSDQSWDAAYLAWSLNWAWWMVALAALAWVASMVTSRATAWVATYLVAFDPFHLFQTTYFMSEAGFTALLMLGVGFALKARTHPIWLMWMSVVVAIASMYRINGIVVWAALIAFSFVYLPRKAEWWKRAKQPAPTHSRMPKLRGWVWVCAAVLVFSLVSMPYFAWRAEHVPHPLDYGTNGRLFADDLWTATDDYWVKYRVSTGGPKEGFSDYVGEHGWGHVLERAYAGIQLQVVDFVGSPGPYQPGRPAEETNMSALAPWFVLPLIVGVVTLVPRRADLMVVPSVVGATLVTQAWMYEVTRSVRYFTPLVGLCVLLAVVTVGVWKNRVRFGHTGIVALLVAYALVFTIYPVLGAMSAWGQLALHEDAANFVLWSGAAVLAATFALMLHPRPMLRVAEDERADDGDCQKATPIVLQKGVEEPWSEAATHT